MDIKDILGGHGFNLGGEGKVVEGKYNVVTYESTGNWVNTIPIGFTVLDETKVRFQFLGTIEPNGSINHHTVSPNPICVLSDSTPVSISDETIWFGIELLNTTSELRISCNRNAIIHFRIWEVE